MKNLTICLSMLFLLFMSCNDDDAPSCDTTAVADVFVGTWTETKVNGIGDEVTFKADGTGFGTEESLFVTELNDNRSTTFIWVLNADKTTVTLTYPNGISTEMNINKVNCNNLELEYGIIIKLARKS